MRLFACTDRLAREGETYCRNAVETQKVLRAQAHELQAANKTLGAENEAFRTEQEAEIEAQTELFRKLEITKEKAEAAKRGHKWQCRG